MKIKKLLAMSVIWLILSLPIVSAQTLNVVRFGGADEAKGYIRPGEKLRAEVEAQLPGEQQIDIQQLRITSRDDYSLFQNCEVKTGTLFTCTYEEENPIPGEYAIRLYTDANKFSETAPPTVMKTLNLTVDSLRPNIKSISVSPPNSKTGDTTLNVQAEDYADGFGDTSTCSGIRTVNITVGGEAAGLKAGNLGECTMQITQPLTTNLEGDLPVCAQATDYVGRPSAQLCTSFLVDNTPPAISNFTLRSPDGGIIITHTKPGHTLDVNVYVNVQGDDRQDGNDVESVKADLSSLNPQYSSPRNYNARYIDMYSWGEIRVTRPQDCEVTFTAKDDVDNERQQTLTCEIKIDETAPTFVQAYGPGEKDGKPLLGKEGVLTVVFEDLDNEGTAGIGLQRTNAYLSMSSLGMGSKRRADNCTQQGTQWACEWQLRQGVQSGAYTVSVHPDTQDDLSNKIAQTQSIQLEVDISEPEVHGLLTREYTPQIYDIPYFPARGHIIHYEWNVTGVSNAAANATAIGQLGEQPGYCTDMGDTQVCSFDVQVEQSGPYWADIEFTFSDEAGNQVKEVDRIFVFGIVDEPNPQYWTASQPECQPTPIDRRLASLIEIKEYCKVPLVSTDPEAAVMGVVPARITDCVGAQGSFADDPYLASSVATRNPILVFTLENKNFAINKLTYNCPMDIYTIKGSGDNRALISTPEREWVNYSLDFFNLPEDDIYEAQNEEIQNAVEDAQDNLEWVQDLSNFVEQAESLCEIRSAVISALEGLVAAAVILDAIASWYPAAAGARDPICIKSAKLREFYNAGLMNILKKFCLFVDCSLDSEGKGTFFDKASYLGGGAPWCKKGEWFEFFTAGTGSFEAGAKGITLPPGATPQTGLNIKDSLVHSTVCLCIPGIVTNLQKLREINCEYAYCLAKDVKEAGIDPTACKAERAYSICAYVVGEIFNLFSITRIINRVITMIRDLLTKPSAMVSLVVQMYCPYTQLTCKGETGPGSGRYSACVIPQLIVTILESVSSWQNLIESTEENKYFEPKLGYCDKLEEYLEDAE